MYNEQFISLGCLWLGDGAHRGVVDVPQCFAHSKLLLVTDRWVPSCRIALPPVWPDHGMKSSPIISKRWPKISHSSLTYYIVTYSKYPKKSVDIWATFAIKFVTNTFQKSPHLVTLIATIANQFMISGFMRLYINAVVSHDHLSFALWTIWCLKSF